MTDVNILAELYMQLGSFAETHALIMRAKQAVKQLQREVRWLRLCYNQGRSLHLLLTVYYLLRRSVGEAEGQ